MTATTPPIDFSPSPDFSQGAWMTFTADHDEDDAAARFLKRHGRPPQWVAEDRRFRVVTLKVGPAPEENEL